MSWNYRVIRTDGADAPWYAIHEVYYGDDNKLPVAVCSEDGLLWVLEEMTKVASKPVLRDDNGRLVEAGE
jgi:hypothetical protein